MRALLVVLLLGLVAVATAHQVSLQPSLLEKKGALKEDPAMEEQPAQEEGVVEEPNENANVEPAIAPIQEVVKSATESGDKELVKDLTTAPKTEDPVKAAQEEGMIVGKSDTVTQEEAESENGNTLTEAEITKRGGEVVESVLQGEPDAMVTKCQFRVRKEWRSMKPEKQQLVLEAFQQLKQKGVYDELVQLYQDNFWYSHGGSGYLPWHRKFLLRVEHKMRDLGGKFACISLPYWDWTMDAGKDEIKGIFCDDLGFGKLEKGCIQSGPFTDWRDPEGAGDDAKINREPAMPFNVAGPAQIKHAIATFKDYGETCAVTGIRQVLEGTIRANTLKQIGGTIATQRGPADPLFFLVHAFIDKLYSMWQDCHDYDQVDKEDITPEMYFEQNYDTADGKNVDATLDAGMPGFGDAATPRNMHNIFELGYGYIPDEWEQSQSFHDNCNWNWFVQEESEDASMIEVTSVKSSLKAQSHTRKAAAQQRAVEKAFAKMQRTAHASLSKTQADFVTVLNDCFKEELVEHGNDCDQAMLAVVKKECELLPKEEPMCEQWAEDNYLHKCDAAAADTFPTLCQRFVPKKEEVNYMSEEDEVMQEYMEDAGFEPEEISGNQDVIAVPEYQVVSN